MQDRLIVYGTLHPDKAPVEIADVVARMKRVGKGTIRGTRYDLGDFPGVRAGSNSKGTVPGEVFLLPKDSTALARLDAYEEFHPDNPQASLFRRRRATVTLSNGKPALCWVYLYNRPVKIKARRDA